jgi:hypothetical protein
VPHGYVVRAQAVQESLDSLAAFEPAYLPPRDAMFSLVVEVTGLELWSGESPAQCFLRLPWSTVGTFSLHNYVDYPIADLLAIYEGHVTTLLAAPVGEHRIELALWGDERHDKTESLLDEYGVRTVLARIERIRQGAVEAAPRGLPPVAVTRTTYPRFTLRRRR